MYSHGICFADTASAALPAQEKGDTSHVRIIMETSGHTRRHLHQPQRRRRPGRASQAINLGAIGTIIEPAYSTPA